MAVSILPRLVAVLYLRMSSDKQDASIPAQRAALIAYAKKRGYTILREYVDEGISGDSDDREAFLRLRQDAVTLRDFAVVLCWDGDRTSRHDFLDFGFWFKPLRDAGIVIETPEGVVDWDTMHGRIILAMQQEMRHEFLRTLSRNISRGFLNGAKETRGVGGVAPSGYKTNGDEVVVDQYWAAIIRRIFVEYLKADASLRSVAILLNSEGIRSRNGGLWSATTVRDVLKNRKYTGAYVRFSRQCGKYHCVQAGEIVPRSKADKTVRVDPLIVENHHEAIVSVEEFEAAQRKLAGSQKKTAHRGQRQYVFSGLIRCGDCGGSMTGKPKMTDGKEYLSYSCKTFAIKGKSACHANSISEMKLVRAVSRRIEEEYLGEAAISRIEKKLRKRVLDDRRRQTPEVDLDRLRKRIADLDRQVDKGAERIFGAPDDLVQTLYRKLDELRSERDRLRQQVEAAGRQEVDLDVEAVVEEALGYLRTLGKQIREAAPEDRQELFRQFIAKIELHFTHRQAGAKQRHDFSHGTIFLRPDPVLSIMLGISKNSSAPSSPKSSAAAACSASASR